MTPDGSRCPVCGASDTFVFLDRAAVPVHQNLLLESAEDARGMARGRLLMRCCDHCGFAWNAAFDEALLEYGPSYENTQTWSPAFQAHVDDRVTHLVDDEGVRNCTVVEVGCGKGRFVRQVVAREGAGNRGVGFDPSYVGPETDLDGRLRFEKRFYDAAAADVHADIVVCRHVIEHVAHPLELLRAVRGALQDAGDARVFFETPCLHWILEGGVVWDLFYEHCSLFTAASLRTAFERAGFRVHGVTHVFDGQYLWLSARPATAAEVRLEPGDTPRLARAFATIDAERRAAWGDRLRAWQRAGPVALWGAGAKGVTFANLLDPEGTGIDCVVDINPGKQGRYLPGTGHPIVGPEALAARRPAFALVLNPVYRAEIEASVARHAPDTRVVDLMQG